MNLMKLENRLYKINRIKAKKIKFEIFGGTCIMYKKPN